MMRTMSMVVVGVMLFGCGRVASLGDGDDTLHQTVGAQCPDVCGAICAGQPEPKLPPGCPTPSCVCTDAGTKPPMCPAVLCAPGCMLKNDAATGCETCDCPETPKPPACQPVSCKMHCEFGWAKDPATGCEVCDCAPPPLCPAILCAQGCTLKKDAATGCDTCDCTPVCPAILCVAGCTLKPDPATGCDTCSCP